MATGSTAPEKRAPHHVQFVEEDDLPEGQDFAFWQWRGELYLGLKREHVCPAVLEDAWTTYRLMRLSMAF